MSVLDSMIASLQHSDERRGKENGQHVVRRSLYKYIYLVCGALVLGGLYRWNATLLCFDRFSPRAMRRDFDVEDFRNTTVAYEILPSLGVYNERCLDYIRKI